MNYQNNHTQQIDTIDNTTAHGNSSKIYKKFKIKMWKLWYFTYIISLHWKLTIENRKNLLKNLCRLCYIVYN